MENAFAEGLGTDEPEAAEAAGFATGALVKGGFIGGAFAGSGTAILASVAHMSMLQIYRPLICQCQCHCTKGC